MVFLISLSHRLPTHLAMCGDHVVIRKTISFITKILGENIFMMTLIIIAVLVVFLLIRRISWVSHSSIMKLKEHTCLIIAIKLYLPELCTFSCDYFQLSSGKSGGKAASRHAAGTHTRATPNSH